MSTEKLIEEVLSLPIEERAFIADSLLKSMNPVDSENDRKWIEVSKKRLRELQSGEVEGVPGDEVFKKIWKRFSE
ncbi:MAG: addiction module protein [Desulfobacterales bacterium]|nr:addiction module protein [Desulfobacterales bacterium]